MYDTAIFDIDGTLVDSNYQHALAWYRAFRTHDLTVPVWQLHRAIGMGGDLLVAHVTNDDIEAELGDDLRDAWTNEFDRLIDEIRPFDGAQELLVEVRRRGFKIVLASSGQTAHVERFLDLFAGRELADAWTTSDDVATSKPDPGILRTALHKVDGTLGVVIGDSTWDCVAATSLGLPALTVLTGGFALSELTNSGATRVFDSLTHLLYDIDTTALGQPNA